MTLNELNWLDSAARATALEKCCGSSNWVGAMNAAFPFPDEKTLFVESAILWYGLSEEDWLEAFTHHPKIGDVNSLKEKFASTATWAEGEQKGVQTASLGTIEALSDGNRAYEEKFGYIFIVCATGKSAEEMLALLQERLLNSPEDEIPVAMAEQDKITQLRLAKLLT